MKTPFFLILLNLLITNLIGEFAIAQGREGFNGSFNSWADVKKRFGAKGNGKDDDTRAIQNAIDSLSCIPASFNTGKNAYTVVYLPAGTYCISSTLKLRGKIGVNIIGEDPASTIIKWVGGDKDTMFWADGSAYYKIARFTWDAGGRKDMEGIGIHWKTRWNDGKTRSFATLNIEVSDNIFIGSFKYGVSGGSFGIPEGTGSNDSEVTIRRCLFDHCTMAGIYIHGYNALDYWIWDCRFLQCQEGVNCMRGNYHVYRSFFSGSKVCDVQNDNGYYISLRGCYSENPNAFSLDAGSSSNPFKRIFQDNTLINPHVLPIEYYHLGKITLMGNKFSATVDTTFKFSVNTKSWAPGIYEVLSLHNTYAYANPIRIASNPNKLYSFGDKQAVVQPDAQAFLKTMDVTPAKITRKVFEVPANADAATIQSILDQAAALKGKRPIVHFGIGSYTIDRTLTIAAGSDMQLIGDGLIYASVIIRKKEAADAGMAILQIQGPSYVNIQDLQIGVDGDIHQPPGIVFNEVDQPGAQVHIDQIYSHADTSLSVVAMNYLYVQKDNSFFMDGNYITGGDLMLKGSGTARVNCFGGQFARVSVQRNGRFLAKDCWWEGVPRIPLNLEGSGTICIDGAKIAPNNVDSTATIRVGKFNGHLCLMNIYLEGALTVQSDNPGLNLLAWNIHFLYKMNVLDFLHNNENYKGAFLGLNAQCLNTKDPACKDIISIKDQLKNVPDVNAFLDTETAYDRESKPVLFKDLPAGVSNIRLSRVTVGSMTRGLVFSANK